MVTRLLVATSILLMWFHSEGTSLLVEDRSLRAAAQSGDVEVHSIDPTRHDMGKVLPRSLRWSGSTVSDQFEDLVIICGASSAMAAERQLRAEELDEQHSLTLHDVTLAASAEAPGSSLATV